MKFKSFISILLCVSMVLTSTNFVFALDDETMKNRMNTQIFSEKQNDNLNSYDDIGAVSVEKTNNENIISDEDNLQKNLDNILNDKNVATSENEKVSDDEEKINNGEANLSDNKIINEEPENDNDIVTKTENGTTENKTTANKINDENITNNDIDSTTVSLTEASSEENVENTEAVAANAEAVGDSIGAVGVNAEAVGVNAEVVGANARGARIADATKSELDLDNNTLVSTENSNDNTGDKNDLSTISEIKNNLSSISEIELTTQVETKATASSLFGDKSENLDNKNQPKPTRKYKNAYKSPNYSVEKVERDEGSGLFGVDPLPSNYDARTETNAFGVPIIPPVRDQSPYGTCWAFSTIGMIETSVRKKNYVQSEGDPGADLSEAALAYFTLEGLEDVTNTNDIDKPGLEGHDYSSLNYEYYEAQGIPRASISFADAGGNQTAATLLASTYMGVVSEADFPHTVENITDIHENGIGDRGRFAFNNNRYEILNADYINKNDITTIKEAILKNGSVGISYCEARNEYNCHERNGEYYYLAPGYFAHIEDDGSVGNEIQIRANHGVMVVGWNDNIDNSYFYYDGEVYEDEGTYVVASYSIARNGDDVYYPTYEKEISRDGRRGAWLVRNSWGENAELMNGGYFWISYYDLTLDDVFYTVEATEKDTYKYNYHYDTTTNTSSYPLYTMGNMGEDRISNVFKVSDDVNQVLEAINVAFKTANFDYTLKIYTNDEEMQNPEDGIEVISQNVHNGAAGVHTIPLEKSIFVKKGTYFSIVIEFIHRPEKYEIFYDYSSSPLNLLAPEDEDRFEYNEVDYNQSWRHKTNENEWSDLNRDFNLGQANGKMYGRNWKIRGLTNEAKIITFNAGGGEGVMAEQGIKVASASTINLNAFTKENATFRRWIGSDGNEYVDGDTITLTDDITLTADWLEISSIRAITPPTKLTYNYGENISLAGLRLRITYTDNTYEEFSYEELNEEDFRVHNNPLNNQLASESNALDCSLIGVSYKNKRIEFDEIDGLAHDIANKFYPITINNTPDFTVPVTLVKNGPYGGTPLSIRNGEAWDMTNTYRYNLINKKSPVFLYNLNGNETFSMDILDFNSIIAGYYLGMGDNNKMIGYDTITDVEIPEGTIKGTQNAYGQITSQEPMSFYFRNNYVLLYIGRQDNNISFYQNFSGLLDSIEVNNMPNKRNYLVGERFDPTGLSINAKNYDGSTYKNKVFEYNDRYRDEFTFSPSLDENLATDVHEITITFRGKTCTFPISVLEDTADLVQVTFDYDDNGRIATVSIPRNSTVFAPNTPTKRGWNFLRWAVPPNYGVAFDFDTPITEDITLEACWMAKAYNVYFHDSLINHSALNHTYIVPFGDTLPLPPTATISFADIGLNIPTGYSFDTWYDKVTETDVTQVTPDDSVPSYNFFAKWRANTYQVSYNLQGVTATLPNNSFTKTYDTPATLNIPSNIPGGCEFLGWYKEPECTNSWDGQTDLTSIQDDDKIIYAKWRERPIASVVALASPSRLHYNVGDTVDLTGLRVRIKYDDNTTRDVEYTNDTAHLFKTYTSFTNEDNIINDREFVTVKYVGEYVDGEYGFVLFDNPWHKDEFIQTRGYKITIDDVNDSSNYLPESTVMWPGFTYIGAENPPPWREDETYKDYLKKHPIILFYKTVGEAVPSNPIKNKKQIGTYWYGIDEETNAMIGYPGMTDIYIPNDLMEQGNDKYMDGYYRGRYFKMYFDVTTVSGSALKTVNFHPYFGKIDNIEIKVNPDKLDYVDGIDRFDPTGLVINAVNSLKDEQGTVREAGLRKEFKYEDHADEITFDVNLAEALTSNQVTINFRGKSCTLDLNLMTPSAESKNVVFKNGYDGTIISTKTIPMGNRITAPHNPVRNHYDFVNWVVEGTDNVFDFANTIINDDYTLVAKWNPHVYPVNIYGAHPMLGPSGTIIFKTINRTYGEDLTLPSGAEHKAEINAYHDPDYLNYEITGYIDRDNGQKLTIILGSDDREVINLYPCWEPEVYDMVYDLAGGSFVDGFTPKATRSYLESLTLPTADRVEKTGYKFKHWRFNTDSENTVRTEIYSRTTNHQVVAVWEKIQYTIKYDVRGLATTPSNSTKIYDTANTLPNLNQIKTGYIFEGWYRDQGYTQSYDINDELSVVDGDIKTIYARFKARITYNANGHGTAPAMDEVILGEAVVLPTMANVDGFTFDTVNSWYDSEDLSNANFVGQAGTEYVVTEPKELYAKWTANTYSVSFNVGTTGATAPTPVSKTYGVARIDDLPTPTNIPSGYEFLGWYKESTYEHQWTGKVANDDLTTENGVTIPVYAKWKRAVVFSVLYNGNNIGAIVPTSIEITSATTITLPNTSAAGYTFGGWYRSATDFSDANRVGGYNDPANVDSPTTFYAKWTANQYTINYNTVLTDANISQNSVPKTYGTPITLHNPSREGYDFAGWYKNYNSANKTYSDSYDGSTDIINTNGGSTTIFAKWTAHSYTIKYNVNGIGTAPNDKPKTYGTPVTLANPTNIPAGYTFDGWYSNSDLADANRYQGATDLTINNGVDVNVYARYKARITYNVNGHGSINPAYTDVVLNGNTVLPTLTNVAGFTFDLTNSWFENSNCEGASVGAASSNYTVVEPKTLFAKWTENEYNIIYHNDDLQGVAYTSGYNKPTTRRYTEAKTLPTSENINRVGYSFAGWWTSDGTTTGQWGSQLTTIAVNTAEDKDIYARWNEISYEVRFVTNGGTLQGFNNPSSRRYSESFTLPTETEILKTGYHFLGWFEHADYTGGPVTQVAANTAETKTYYARWEINTYNITYHTNGGTLDGTEDTDRLYTESVNLPVEPHISRNNYIFKGWWTSDGITMGTWGNQVSNVVANTANDVEVWARWAASYTVSFNLDSSEKPATVVATNIPANQNIEQGFKAQAPTSTPTANGYEFLGWYTDTTWSTVFNFNNTTIEGNTTVYAKWHQVQTITFTFNMQGHGTQVDTQYVVENNRVVRPTNPTAVGYNFIRWYEGTDTSVAFDFTQVIPGTSANPRTLNALWDEIEYTVAYNLNGGTVAETLDTARLYHEAMQLPNNTTNPNNVTKNGFTFGGWYDNPAFNGQSYDNIPANTAENKQFYAKWNGIEYSITLNELGGTQPTTGAQSIPTSYVSGIGTSLPMDFRKNNVPIVGWYTGYDETTGNYSGTRYTSIGNAVIGDLVLYARYGTPLTITFNAGGGTGSMGNQSVYQGVPTAINSNQFRRSGYEFNGWRGSNGLSYSNGQTITITTNLSLTATWKKVPSGGGGGRGGGGGGGGGGGMALPKTEPAPTTTENAVAKPLQEIRLDISQIEWKFEITTNKFKMNINNNGQTTLAKNGFYTVNFVVTQKTNEIETKISASNTYYFDAEGNMTTGWVKTVENKWYFFENAKTIDEGKMIVGWKKIQNDWYYFTEDGSMLISTTTPDGYTVGSDGKMM